MVDLSTESVTETTLPTPSRLPTVSHGPDVKSTTTAVPLTKSRPTLPIEYTIRDTSTAETSKRRSTKPASTGSTVEITETRTNTRYTGSSVISAGDSTETTVTVSTGTSTNPLQRGSCFLCLAISVVIRF